MRELMFDGKRALQYVKKLAVDIGERQAGSANEHKASRYLRDKFKEFGLKSSLLPYRIHAFDKTEAFLSVPGLGEVGCTPVACCANTPAKGMTAELVFIEEGHEVYLEPSMQGKVIMTYGGFSGAGYEAMMKLKPAGLIRINKRMFLPPSHNKVRPDISRRLGSVPTINITYEDGMKILVRKPRRVTLFTRTTGERIGRSFNVMGELKGSKKPDEVIVVGGHLDSVWGSQGCQDNAAGTAIVMELARVFARRGSQRTLRFMGFSGEETGLYGSTAYLKKLKKDDARLKKNKDFVRDGLSTELDRIRLMINIDVHGTKLASHNFLSMGPADIAASVRLLSAEAGPSVHVDDNHVQPSDNAVFSLSGIPTASFSRMGAAISYMHTYRDAIELCDEATLVSSGRLIEGWMLRHITESKVFPFKREISGDMKKQLNKFFAGIDIFKWEPEIPRKRYKGRK